MENNKKLSSFLIVCLVVIFIITFIVSVLFIVKNNQKKPITQCDVEYYLYNKSCYPCYDKFINCSECNNNKCLSCKDGFTWSETEKKCKTELKTRVIKNILWAEFNAGDVNGPEIPQGVKICKTKESCIIENDTTPVCWQGRTSGENCNNTTGYSGCTRTVCNWYAANKICEENYMKLPSNDEFALMDNYKDNYLLHFCGTSNPLGDGCPSINSCYFRFGKNKYENRSVCFPNFYWGREGVAAYLKNNMELDVFNGSNNSLEQSKAWATGSVRCILNCPETFGKGCIDCSVNQCLNCKNGYKLQNGMCASFDNKEILRVE